MAPDAIPTGALLYTSSRIQRIVVDSSQVRLTATATDGPPLSVHASLVVLACGVNYQLTKRLGLGTPGAFLQGVQAEVPWVWTDNTEVHLNKALSPDAFAWVVPLQNGSTRVGVMCAQQARSALERVLDRMAPHWRGRPDIRLAAKPIAQTTLRRSYAERVLVIGEAAGQVKATTGGGIYYGMLAAQLAADTNNTAFASGDFSATGLQRYERAWRALLGDELRLGLWFRKLYSWLGDRQVDSLLQTIATNGLKDVIRRQAHFDWHRGLIMELGRRLPFGKLALSSVFGL